MPHTTEVEAVQDQGFNFLDKHSRADRRRATRARSIFNALSAADLDERGAAPLTNSTSA
jgi:hypothetical protein